MKVLALICLVAAVGYVQAFQSCIPRGSFPDLVLVVEDSDHMTETDEPHLREFLAEIANNFNLEADSARVAYELYNSSQRVVFNLNTYDQTKDAVSTIMTTLLLHSDDTNPIVIADALDYTWTNMLSVTNGERSCHPTVVVLVSYSGYPDVNGQRVGDPNPYYLAKDQSAVRRLKDSGALIITVGVGPDRNPKYLLDYASGHEYYHDFPTFAELTTDAADAIAAQACAYMPDGSFYPCEMKVVQADIVFVVDVSQKFNETYKSDVLDFMNNTLKMYTYDHKTGVQAALVTYQKDADIQINFNDEDNDNLAHFLDNANEKLVTCVDFTDRCVEDALDKIQNHIFIANTGYRSTCTIHQIYIFTSDCFTCGDPVPLAQTLRSSTQYPHTEIFVIPLQYGVPNPPGPGFWKEYLEIASDASHLWEAYPDPTPIVTEYLHKQAWRAVCRSFENAKCALPPPVNSTA